MVPRKDACCSQQYLEDVVSITPPRKRQADLIAKTEAILPELKGMPVLKH